MININGIDKAELLAALVNGAQPMGMGWLRAGKGPMTKEQAQEWIDQARGHDDDMPNAQFLRKRALRFDYVMGRPIKSDLSGDEFDPRLYDRDQGEGAAARVVSDLREKMGGTQ